jgi:hypothetical protein
MTYKIYYGVGPTFQSHIAKHGFPRDGDFLFDTFDHGKKIKIDNHVFTVLNPSENINLLAKGEIIICSIEYQQIQRNLKRLKPDEPLNIKISDIVLTNDTSSSFNLIVSSADAEIGGVFRLIWNHKQKNLERLCSGDMRGITYKERDLFAVKENVGIGFLGPNGFELIKKIENKNIHSMIYVKDIDQFILAETYSDSIVFLSGDDFKEKKRLRWGNTGQDKHHINSLCVHDGYLYFSAFSSKGVWPLGIWNDGCIGRVPLDTNSMNDVELISVGLRQPHSVLIDPSQTAICESQERTLVVSSRIRAKLYGYTRGLCKVASGYFVGCSEIRRQNNFVKGKIPFAKGASVNFISNDFSAVESFNLPLLSVYEIISEI